MTKLVCWLLCGIFTPIRQDKPPALSESSHRPHTGSDQSRTPSTRCGLSCLSPLFSANESVQFFTGGYDKSIRLWTLHPDNMALASSESISKIGTIPSTLAAVETTLYVGTGQKILTLDIDHPTARPRQARCGNAVSQIHVHDKNVFIVEVNFPTALARRCFSVYTALLTVLFVDQPS